MSAVENVIERADEQIGFLKNAIDQSNISATTKNALLNHFIKNKQKIEKFEKDLLAGTPVRVKGKQIAFFEKGYFCIGSMDKGKLFPSKKFINFDYLYLEIEKIRK